MAELNVKPGTLMQGDNLDFLRAINTECIDLIATDPPFNKGKKFQSTPDKLGEGVGFHDRWHWKSWKEKDGTEHEPDIDESWCEQIQDDWPSVWAVIDWSRMTYGDDMGAFLCYMGVRLLEMHRILKPTGSLYIHCDPTASHYLKTLLDAIFGYKNFRNEIIWGYRKWTNSASSWQKNHDVILFYSKNSEPTFNKQYDKNSPQAVKHARGWDRNKANGVRQLIVYNEEKAQKEINKKNYDRLVMRPGVNGTAFGDWWDINYLASGSKERVGYPTQKPVDLYKRIISASSNEGDVVLDPFCGCATTLIAAQQLDRQWVGMDLWTDAIEVVKKRLDTECPMFTGYAIDTSVAPLRTDAGDTAAPLLKAKSKSKRDETPENEKMPHNAMREILYAEQSGYCAGCNINLPLRYFELDHRRPKSDGGHNGISNRILLCGPCNKKKSNTLTLPGLIAENKKEGLMMGA